MSSNKSRLVRWFKTTTVLHIPDFDRGLILGFMLCFIAMFVAVEITAQAVGCH